MAGRHHREGVADRGRRRPAAAVAVGPGHQQRDHRHAFSPDGTRVLAGSDDTDAGVKIWDVGPTGDAELANLATPDGQGGVAFLPDGQRLVALVPTEPSGLARAPLPPAGEAHPRSA